MLKEHIRTPAMRVYFESLGLDVSDAWSFFKLLDEDGGAVVPYLEDHPLHGVILHINGLNGLQIGVTNHLLTGMIVQVGGGFKYFLCSSLLGEDEPILTNIFQMG